MGENFPKSAKKSSLGADMRLKVQQIVSTHSIHVSNNLLHSVSTFNTLFSLFFYGFTPNQDALKWSNFVGKR